MTAQVFFVVASARNAVLVPVAALRPAPTEGRQRGARGGGERKGERKAGERRGEGKGGERRGERASGADPRAQFSNGPALVSVVDAKGDVTDREVRVGVMNRVSAEIVSGLKAGEKVVIGTRTAEAKKASAAKSALVPGGGGTGGAGGFKGGR